MKLAEALQERADLNRRIEQLKYRLLDNALVQEGEEPAEDPNDLLEQLNADINSLEALIAQINLKNASVTVEGKTLTELIAQRDMLNVRIDAYRQLISSASTPYERARNSEIRIISAVNVRELQKKSDAISKELRQLDNLIQSTNWTTEM